MPRAYYQCPKCRQPFSTKYSGPYNEPPDVKHECAGEMVAMTFRGNGWDGRDNWPHGQPPKLCRFCREENCDGQCVNDGGSSDAI